MPNAYEVWLNVDGFLLNTQEVLLSADDILMFTSYGNPCRGLTRHSDSTTRYGTENSTKNKSVQTERLQRSVCREFSIKNSTNQHAAGHKQRGERTVPHAVVLRAKCMHRKWKRGEERGKERRREGD